MFMYLNEASPNFDPRVCPRSRRPPKARALLYAQKRLLQAGSYSVGSWGTLRKKTSKNVVPFRQLLPVLMRDGLLDAPKSRSEFIPPPLTWAMPILLRAGAEKKPPPNNVSKTSPSAPYNCGRCAHGRVNPAPRSRSSKYLEYEFAPPNSTHHFGRTGPNAPKSRTRSPPTPAPPLTPQPSAPPSDSASAARFLPEPASSAEYSAALLPPARPLRCTRAPAPASSCGWASE